MITSLLMQDLYKLTMMQFVLHRCSGANVTYHFKCRNEDVDLLPYKDQINHGIDRLCTLRFTKDELNYLTTFGFFKQDFIDFLEDFRLKRKYIEVTEKKGKLDITIKGPFLQTIMFEIFILQIVHHVYNNCVYNYVDTKQLYAEGFNRLDKKIEMIKEYNDKQKEEHKLQIIEFGTRRSFDQFWLSMVIEKLNNKGCIVGTSNLYYAMKYNIPAIGTMAHEILMAYQVLNPTIILDRRIKQSQSYFLNEWLNEYGRELNIALTDTLGTDTFLKNFNYAQAYDYVGLRHDSGDPFKWGDKIISFYNNYDIDPREKKLIFSDGLDVPTAIKLNDYFKNRIKISFGIGTNLTNDLGVPALQNVIKLVNINGSPVAKLSDNPGKGMCEDQNYLNYLNKILQH